MVTKKIADGLTFLRVLTAAAVVWLGLTKSSNGLKGAVLLLLIAWTSDALDGPLARRSDRQYHSWLGDHDLEVDMVVSLGLLSFMVAAGFVEPWVGVAYAATALIFFGLTGFSRSIGMLFQAPIYCWFIWISFNYGGWVGWLPFLWIMTAVLLTWPRFPKDVVPEFVAGMQEIFKKT